MACSALGSRNISRLLILMSMPFSALWHSKVFDKSYTNFKVLQRLLLDTTQLYHYSVRVIKRW